MYFENNKVFYRDNDPASGLTTGTATTYSFNYEPTGRMILIDDAFKSPILYYRANERAAYAFTRDAAATGAHPGIYNHADNALITGTVTASTGWDFANAGKQHQIAPYSYNENDPTSATDAPNDNPIDDVPTTPAGFTNTFVRYLHNESACKSTATIRPMNPDTGILISAGKDGVYGTDDDINNFTTR